MALKGAIHSFWHTYCNFWKAHANTIQRAPKAKMMEHVIVISSGVTFIFLFINLTLLDSYGKILQKVGRLGNKALH